MKNRPFRTVCIITLLCFLAISVCPPAYAENENITEAGDYVQIILPTVAMLSTFVAGNPEGGLWDKEGTWQGAKSIGFALATMGLGKVVADKTRPDGSDANSFPSGHTTAAFAGAGFIDQRYGHWWGVPSLLAAGFVGYSRIQSSNHFTDDVVAGASIGLLSNWLFVTPQTESVSVMPMVTDGGAGVMVTSAIGGSGNSETKPETFAARKTRYNFTFGPAFLEKNEIKASADNGTRFDLADFEKINDPTTTAVAELDFYIGNRHEMALYFSPYESKDRGMFTSPVSFAGQLYPAGEKINSDWLIYDVRGRWLYNLVPDSKWELKLGASLAYQYIEASLTTASGTMTSEVKDHVFLPLVSAVAGYQFTPSWSAGIELDGIYLSDDSALEAGLYLNYRITDRWDFTAGYRYYSRDIDTSDVQNNVVYHIPYLSVAYSWQ